MTPEEQEEYARRVAEGYGRLERLVRGHALADEEVAALLRRRFREIVGRLGKDEVLRRVSRGVEFYQERLGGGQWHTC